jgi:hypothetical protein
VHTGEFTGNYNVAFESGSLVIGNPIPCEGGKFGNQPSCIEPCQWDAKIPTNSPDCKEPAAPNAATYSYSSSDDTVASVDAKGNVTFHRVGTVVISKCELIDGKRTATPCETKEHKKTLESVVTENKVAPVIPPKLTDVLKLSDNQRKAVNWLAKNGVVVCADKAGKIVKKCDFNPKNKVSKGMFAELLWKLIGSPDIITKGGSKGLAKYKTTFYKKDKELTTIKKSYKVRYSAIQWLVNNKVIAKPSASAKFAPKKNITKAEITKLLKKLDPKALTAKEVTKVVKTLPSKNISRVQISTFLVDLYKAMF